MARHDG
jgi:hypothetical protein